MYLRAALLSLITVSLCLAESQPQPPLVSPEIQADNSVTFRLKAAQATTVLVRGDWSKEPLAMTKNDQGVWTASSTALPPGLWSYSFVIDGELVVDALNGAVVPMQQTRLSLLHLPTNPPQPWDWQDIPHGTLHTHPYHSKAFNAPREVVVYTPPGYEKNNEHYPVLVLQAGSKATQRTWTEFGHVHLILDALIAQKKAKPMLVVMLNSHAPNQPSNLSSDQRWMNTMTNFRDELTMDALPLVESLYRVGKEPGDWAIAGLSLGAGQALGIGMSLPRFGWIGSFAAPPPPLSLIQDSLTDAATTNARIKLLWITVGQDDFLLKGNTNFNKLLTEHGITHEYHLTDGNHAWTTFRQNLISFLPRLFQP
jgi:enterochelin esterase-like enzyme